MKIKVSENLTVEVRPNAEHEFLMTTNEFAKGYGVSGGAVRAQLHRNADELTEGKHYFTSVTKRNTGCVSGGYLESKQVFWTKRGIVRLGFFIKSERARMFRDWAEDLIIGTLDMAERAHDLGLLPETPKRKHNRLTPERMVDILADVARIDNKGLRLSLISKLTK